MTQNGEAVETSLQTMDGKPLTISLTQIWLSQIAITIFYAMTG